MKTKLFNIAVAALLTSIAIAPQVEAKLRGAVRAESVEVKPGVVLMLTLNGPIQTGDSKNVGEPEMVKGDNDNLPNVAANDGTWSLRAVR